MSRLYDAKQAALKAHKDDVDAAIDLFIGYVGMDTCDIEYEIGMTCEEYLFGDKKKSEKDLN